MKAIGWLAMRAWRDNQNVLNHNTSFGLYNGPLLRVSSGHSAIRRWREKTTLAYYSYISLYKRKVQWKRLKRADCKRHITNHLIKVPRKGNNLNGIVNSKANRVELNDQDTCRLLKSLCLSRNFVL